MKSYSKQYLSFLIIATVVINACNPTKVDLKGKYLASPLEISSTKSIDSIWSDVTRLFATNGLSIERIEKKKGLIVSTKTSFIPVYTFEDKDGRLQKPKAWVVLPRVVVNKKEWNPKTIYSEWSVQINETEKGTTTIKVDPIVICNYSPNKFTTVEIRGQSTGNFEELLKRSLINK